MPSRIFILLLGIVSGVFSTAVADTPGNQPVQPQVNQAADGPRFNEQLVQLGRPRPGWSLLRSSVTTSYDSAHVGFKTSQDDQLMEWAMVCDNRFQALLVAPGFPIFTPDSTGIAYFFQEGLD